MGVLWRWLTVSTVVLLAACGTRQSTHVVRYPSGTIRWKVPTVNGIPHGLSETFHANGQLASRGEYRDGKRNGVFDEWDERGSFVRRVAYASDELVWTTTSQSEQPPTNLEALRQRPPPAPQYPIDKVRFVGLDPATPGSVVSAQLGLHSIESSDRLGRRYNLSGQYSYRDYSGYGWLSTSSIESMTGESLRGKTSAELGGRLHRELAGMHVAGNLGLLVPLAGDDFEGFVSASATGHERFNDVASTFPQTLALRLGGAMMLRGRFAFVAVNAGVDTLARVGDDTVGFDGSAALLGRLNIGLGVGARNFALTVEVANAGLLTSSDPAFERFVHSFSIVAQMTKWKLVPALGFAVPVWSGNERETGRVPVAAFVNVTLPLEVK